LNATDESPPDVLDPGQTMTLRALAGAILRRPRVALEDVALRPGRRWLVPVLALAIVASASAVAAMPARQEALRSQMAEARARIGDRGAEMDAEQAAQTEAAMGMAFRVSAASSAVAAVITPFVALLAVAAALHLFGTVMGGQQSFGQMLAVASWARVPLVFQEALRLVFHLAGGFDVSPKGLSGLVATDGASPWGPVLAEVSVWNVWSLALLALAVATVSRVSRRKGAAAVVGVVALRLAAGEVAVAMAHFFSNFGG